MSLTAGQLETLHFDYDLSGTHVEEMDDFEVAVWIQKYDNTLTATWDAHRPTRLRWQAVETSKF